MAAPGLTMASGLTSGPSYLILEARDPRLIGDRRLCGGEGRVWRPASRRGPIDELEAYRRPARRIGGGRSALLMRPVFEAAATAAKRIVFAEGEDERVLRAPRRSSRRRRNNPA